MVSRPEPAAGFLAHRGLIILATGAAMAEAGILIAVAPAARVLAPQVTALPPLGVFHDLRWLYSGQHSWLSFGLLLAVLILGRSAANAALVLLAWPAARQRPGPTQALRSAAGFTVFACLLMSPVVSLTLGVAILPFSWPFLATLPAMLLIAIPLSHGGMASTWWRMLPPGPAVGWLFADFLTLSAAAAVTGRLPLAGAVPVAGLAGLVNARAWYGMTAAVARAHADAIARDQAHGPVRALLPWAGRLRRPAHLPAHLPAAPLAAAAAIAVVIAVTRLVFILTAVPGQEQQASAASSASGGVGPAAASLDHQAQSGHDPVLVVPGFGSWCCTHGRSLARAMPNRFVRQFSYRGLNPAGNPLPYGPAASNLPLPVLGDRIAAQVWRLHDSTGRPVDVVAESEGTLGVYAMLARHPGVPVAAIALLSPIVAPGQASYPVGSGWAVVPGGELQAVVWFVGGLSPFGTSGAQTLIASVNRVGARFAAAASRHRGLRWLELVPLADAVTLPACRLPSNVVVVPALHGQLLGDPVALRMVREFLAHERVTGTAGLRTTAQIVATTAAAWRIPQAVPPSPPCQP